MNELSVDMPCKTQALSIARKCSSKKIGTQYNTDQVQNEKI
jgi:hypothetical protein